MQCLDPNDAAAFLDGAFSEAECDDVHGHLDDCSSCRLVVVQTVRMRDSAVLSNQGVVGAEIAMRLQVGDAVDRYRILGELGRGGMSIVYHAYDPQLDREVAIKFLRVAVSAERRVDLMIEARVLARLDHPNIVAAYDFGEFQGHPYLAMEYVAGCSLRQWLAGRRDDWRAGFAILQQAAGALSAAHGAGVVHRDFKPENVIISDTGDVKVVDFGLSVTEADGATNTASGPHTIAGTPDYMAPEQRAGEPVDARSDQFSFCVVAVEVLSGRRPRGRNDPLAGVPKSITAAVRRGLDLDPRARFASIDALVRAMTRFRGRRRRLAAFAASIASFGLGAVAVSFYVAGERELCARADTASESIWNDAKSSVLHTKYKDYPTTAQLFEQGASRYVQSWRREAVTACRDTHERQIQSVAVLDLRTSCLRRELLGFASTVHAVVSERVTVHDGLVALYALPSPGRCANMDEFGRAPVNSEDVVELNHALTELEIAAEANPKQLEKLRAQGRKLTDRTRESEDTRLIARAELWLGRHGLDGRAQRLWAALAAAQSAEDLRLRATIWVALAKLAAISHDETSAGNYLAQARSLATKLAYPYRLECGIAQVEVHSAGEKGDFANGIAIAKSVVERMRSVGSAHSDLVFRSLMLLVSAYQRSYSHDGEAAATLRQARAVGVSLYGEKHRELAFVEFMAAHQAIRRKDFDTALASAKRYVDIVKGYPGFPYEYIDGQLLLATALLRVGQYAKATAQLKRANAAIDKLDSVGLSRYFRRVVNNQLSSLYSYQYKPKLAVHHARAYLSAAQEEDKPVSQAKAHYNLAEQLRLAGACEESMPHYESARTLAGGLPTPIALLDRTSLTGIGMCQAELGKFASAKKLLTKMIAQFRDRAGTAGAVPSMRFALGKALYGLGQRRRGIAEVQDAIATLRNDYGATDEPEVRAMETWLARNRR